MQKGTGKAETVKIHCPISQVKSVLVNPHQEKQQSPAHGFAQFLPNTRVKNHPSPSAAHREVYLARGHISALMHFPSPTNYSGKR